MCTPQGQTYNYLDKHMYRCTRTQVHSECVCVCAHANVCVFLCVCVCVCVCTVIAPPKNVCACGINIGLLGVWTSGIQVQMTSLFPQSYYSFTLLSISHL